MTICTFAGHRTILFPEVDQMIASALNQLLETDDRFIFLSGGMGEFDRKCEAAVRRLKQSRQSADISLCLVLPYMTNRINTDKVFYESRYDDIIFPPELAQVHYRSAIRKRNQWMVEQANQVIAFVHRSHGGAYDALKYAQKLGKTVVNLADRI